MGAHRRTPARGREEQGNEDGAGTTSSRIVSMRWKEQLGVEEASDTTAPTRAPRASASGAAGRSAPAVEDDVDRLGRLVPPITVATMLRCCRRETSSSTSLGPRVVATGRLWHRRRDRHVGVGTVRIWAASSLSMAKPAMRKPLRI
jgi:hypothetical protein